MHLQVVKSVTYLSSSPGGLPSSFEVSVNLSVLGTQHLLFSLSYLVPVLFEPSFCFGLPLEFLSV